ncbi:MAG: pyruvate, water dikinase regulatory protein [Alphaproteobacteria bacterium]
MSPDKPVHFHLVSDATGETISSLGKAVISQFDIKAQEHLWPLVRNRTMADRVLAGVRRNRGLVLYTIVEPELDAYLRAGCADLKVPVLPVLEPLLGALSHYLGLPRKPAPGRQHAMDAEYHRRIEAVHFTMAHDDGQGLDSIASADVILVGVSRTSKTPTCIYLANRGIKSANVPLVEGIAAPPGLPDGGSPGPLVVGLTTEPGRLVQVRRARLATMGQTTETDYVDADAVRKELAAARRYFQSRGWPVMDVTRWSIEETAAAVLGLLNERRDAAGHS